MLRYLRHLVATALFLGSWSVRAQISITPSRSTNAPVTFVTGESWLNHLHKPFNETSMGKTGHLGPRPYEPGEEDLDWKLRLSINSATSTALLHGSDLYRMNCQGCHRESGLGAPPEIAAIIDPVRATSANLVMERMKNVGMSMTPAAAAQLARQSQQALLQRLHNGGDEMPAFAHLSAAEVHSLVAYLKQLASVPGAEGEQRIIRAPPVRVGELIVKSTCHVCHDASGPNPNPEQLGDGAIPPLETLTARTNLAEFVHKITAGAPVVMGNPPMLSRGRMPVFDYLSQDEAADVYLYLNLYAPSATGVGNQGRARLQPTLAVSGAQLHSLSAVVPSLQNTEDIFKATQSGDWMPAILILGVVWFTLHLLGGGVVLVLAEFRKIAERSNHRGELQKISVEKEGLHHPAA